MKQIRFSGRESGRFDNFFGCYCAGIHVEHNNRGNGKPISILVYVGGQARIVVTGQFAPDSGPEVSTWAITVQAAIPKGAFDGLKIYMSNNDLDYSPKLTVEGPDNMTAVLIPDDEEDDES